MKVHAFRIVPRGNISLDAVLNHLVALPLPARLRTVFGVPMRLEFGNKRGNRYWLLDFGLIRHDGPGRASANAPIQDFDLQPDEGFGLETAAYFDTRSHFMTLQYNHNGARARRIESYLYSFERALAGQPEGDERPDDASGFTFVPVVKPEAANRLQNVGIVKSIDVSFYLPGLLAQHAQQRRSLSALLDTPILGDAERVRLHVAAGQRRGASLRVQNVIRAVRDLLPMREQLYDLNVTAKAHEDAPSEPVDFLEARLEADMPILVGPNRRYGRDERFAALQQTHEIWSANGLLRVDL